MRSTMQDYPLTVNSIFAHGRTVHAGSEVSTLGREGVRRARFDRVAERSERLAAALKRLGIGSGDRVATFCWNSQEHLEAYLAIPCVGAVLHTLNVRLFPEQLVYVVNHAEDRVLLVDDSLVPALAGVADQLASVKHFIVIGDGDSAPLDGALRYEEVVGAEKAGHGWPAIDENAAAAMCYTSGTTGHPKGVVYSHRSTFLHSLATCAGWGFALSEHDRVLPVVPMFHAMAWGLPYAAWMAGAGLVMPGRFLQAEPLCRLIAEERPTISAGVPTIWNEILRYAESNPVDLSSLRQVVSGGSAVPRKLMEEFQARHGVRIIQAWGMTETSPLGAMGHPPRGVAPEEEMDWRSKTGRVMAGVEFRIVDEEGEVLPWDGKAIGEIEVRGPWITGGYYMDAAPDKFHDGWLRTGDVGMIDPKGYVQITDRAKDVIKSGGEWISSVELENEIMAHPGVIEAAVIGVPDEKWEERPLACVVLREDAKGDPDALAGFLADRVARWWVPERWTFIQEVPKTSVGKFDKKLLRSWYGEGKLAIRGKSRKE